MSRDILTSKDQLDDLIITEDSHLKLVLDDSADDIFLKIMPNYNLELVIISKNISNKITIEIGENSLLRYKEIALNTSHETKIKMKKGSELDYHFSLIAKHDIDLKINIIHQDEDTLSRLNNSIVNTNGSVINLLVNDQVYSQNTDSNQSNTIYALEGGTNLIKPNLIVNTDEVEANHASYIGRFKEEDLFYLQSRGLKLKEAEKLLINGFLMNGMDLNHSLSAEFHYFIQNNLKEEL